MKHYPQFPSTQGNFNFFLTKDYNIKVSWHASAAAGISYQQTQAVWHSGAIPSLALCNVSIAWISSVYSADRNTPLWFNSTLKKPHGTVGFIDLLSTYSIIYLRWAYKIVPCITLRRSTYEQSHDEFMGVFNTVVRYKFNGARFKAPIELSLCLQSPALGHLAFLLPTIGIVITKRYDWSDSLRKHELKYLLGRWFSVGGTLSLKYRLSMTLVSGMI